MFNHEERSPMMQFMELSSAFWISQALNVAARLGIADHIKGEARTVHELATATQSNEAYLYRLLRSLASVGVFSEIEPQRFALTPVGEFLRSDIERSLRYVPIMHGDDWHWNGINAMHDVVRTGKPASQILRGIESYWHYLSENPDYHKHFNWGMLGVAMNYHTPFVETYDFGGVRQVIDIAGGEGTLIRTILRTNPHLSGILFEIPETVPAATQAIEHAGLSERCRVVSGDVFDAVPAGGDLYTLSYVLIDWNDRNCAKVLSNIRRAIHPTGKLLVIDSVITEGNDYTWAKWVDLFELCYGSGRVRKQSEFEQMYKAAGFRWVRTIEMGTPSVVMELVPDGPG